MLCGLLWMHLHQKEHKLNNISVKNKSSVLVHDFILQPKARPAWPQHFNIYSVLKVVLFSYKKYLPACFPIKNVLTKKKERNKEVT